MKSVMSPPLPYEKHSQFYKNLSQNVVLMWKRYTRLAVTKIFIEFFEFTGFIKRNAKLMHEIKCHLRYS
jgi:hypothetical protein